MMMTWNMDRGGAACLQAFVSGLVSSGMVKAVSGLKRGCLWLSLSLRVVRVELKFVRIKHEEEGFGLLEESWGSQLEGQGFPAS
jgi:hypothetical protein